MEAHKERTLSEFKDYLNPIYSVCIWRYLGRLDGDVIKILTGSLRFESVADAPHVDTIDVESAGLVGGVMSIEAAEGAGLSFVEALILGKTHSLPKGRFQLVTGERAECDIYLRQPWYDFINPAKVATLQITGGPCGAHISDKGALNAKLRADPKPFDDLQELLRTVGLPQQNNDNRSVDVSVTPLARFAGATDDLTTQDHKALLALEIPKDLDIGSVRLGWRLSHNGQVIDRSSVSGDKLDWDKKQDVWTCTHKLEVPDGGALHCYLSVDNRVQSERRIKRHTLGNTKLEAFELFDPKLKWVQAHLFNRDYSKRNSRTFEEAVAYLLFFLGFSGMNFGAQLTTGPDGLAFTATGDIAVIECTIETYDAGKVENLVDRTDRVRAKARSSSLADKRVIPVMVTLQARNEDENWVKRTTDLGAVLIDANDLLRLFAQAQSQVDCHLEVFDELCKAIRPRNVFSKSLQLG